MTVEGATPSGAGLRTFAIKALSSEFVTLQEVGQNTEIVEKTRARAKKGALQEQVPIGRFLDEFVVKHQAMLAAISAMPSPLLLEDIAAEQRKAWVRAALCEAYTHYTSKEVPVNLVVLNKARSIVAASKIEKGRLTLIPLCTTVGAAEKVPFRH